MNIQRSYYNAEIRPLQYEIEISFPEYHLYLMFYVNWWTWFSISFWNFSFTIHEIWPVFQPESTSIFMAPVITEDCADAQVLSLHLKPCWCLRVMLLPEPYKLGRPTLPPISMVTSNLSCGERPCLGPWPYCMQQRSVLVVCAFCYHQMSWNCPWFWNTTWAMLNSSIQDAVWICGVTQTHDDIQGPSSCCCSCLGLQFCWS